MLQMENPWPPLHASYKSKSRDNLDKSFTETPEMETHVTEKNFQWIEIFSVATNAMTEILYNFRARLQPLLTI